MFLNKRKREEQEENFEHDAKKLKLDPTSEMLEKLAQLLAKQKPYEALLFMQQQEGLGELEQAQGEACLLHFHSMLVQFKKNYDAIKMMQVRDLFTQLDTWMSIEEYNMLFEACFRKEMDQKAMEFLEELQQSNGKVAANADTHTLFIVGCAKAGRMDDANAFVDEMRKLNSNYQFDETIYQAYITGYAKNGNLQEAEAQIAKLKKQGVKLNHATYHALIQGYVQNNQLDMAEKKLEEMESQGLKVESASYVPFLTQYASQCKIAPLFEIVDKMKNRGVAIDIKSFNSVISALLKSEDVDNALRVIERMKDYNVQPNSVTFHPILSAYCKLGQFVKAERLMKQMKRQNATPDVFSYTCLINGYAKAQEFDKVQEVYKRMTESGIKPNQVTGKVLQQLGIDVGEIEVAPSDETTAKNNSNDSNKTAKPKKQKDLASQNHPVIANLRRLLRSGAVSDILATMNTALKTNVIIPEQLIHKAFIQLASGKNLTPLVQLVQEMEGKEYKLTHQHYASVLKCCFELGKTKQAMETYHSLPQKGIEVTNTIVTTMIQGYQKQGEINTRNPNNDVIIDAASTHAYQIYTSFVEQHKPELATINAMIQCLGTAGKSDLALKVYKDTSKYQLLPNKETQMAILFCLAKTGRRTDAETILAEIKQKPIDKVTLHSYQTLINGIDERKYKREVLKRKNEKWLKEMGRKELDRFAQDDEPVYTKDGYAIVK